MNQDLIKDSLRLFTANALIKPLWFVFIIVSARILGPEDFGLFALATVMVSILFIVFESGVDVSTMKTLAMKPEEHHRLVDNGFFAKLLVIASCGLLAYLGSFGLKPEVGSLVRLAIPISAMQAILMFMRHIYRGRVWFDLEGRSIVVERGFIILFASISLWISGDVIWYMVAYVIAYGIVLTFDWLMLTHRSQHHVSIPPFRVAFAHIRTSVSIGVYNALSVLFTRIGTIVLYGAGMGKADIGRFNSGIRLFDSFALLPTIISEPLYPRICTTIHNRDALTDIVRFPAVFLFAVTVFASSILLANHRFIIDLILGADYAISSLEIALTFSTIVLFSMNTITTKLIIASGRENVLSRILFVMLASQIAALLLVMPHYGLIGVVLVYVGHEVLYNTILTMIAYRSTHAWRIYSGYGLVMVAAFIGFAVTYIISISIPVVSILVQATVMTAMMLAFGLFRFEQLQRLFTSIRS